MALQRVLQERGVDVKGMNAEKMRDKLSYVVSEPYSRIPGDHNWRHRVVDIDFL